MMRFKLAEVQRHECSKPGCTHSARIERHHKGCEGMWVRHFAWRRSKRYKAYKEHYEAFHEEDITRLCRPHHNEIHTILWVLIGRAVRKSRLHPSEWSWEAAEALIEKCKTATDEWLQRQTPGVLERPTTHTPSTPSKLQRATPRQK